MLAHYADAAAFLAFLVAWMGYARFVKLRHDQNPGLNALMNAKRSEWMSEMARREVRIVDTAITSTLQNGTAFFASTSLLALGGAATVLRPTEDVVRLFSELPFAEDHRPDGDLRLRLLQVRLVLPPLQLFRDPDRRHAARRFSRRHCARKGGAARGQHEHRRRPSFRRRPARAFLVISPTASARFSSPSPISAGISGRSSSCSRPR